MNVQIGTAVNIVLLMLVFAVGCNRSDRDGKINAVKSHGDRAVERGGAAAGRSSRNHQGFTKVAISFFGGSTGFDHFRFHFDEPEGTAFYHVGGESMKVMSVDDDGVLVLFADGSKSRVIFIRAHNSDYVDGVGLKAGIYVRRGIYRYISANGAKHTVAAFEEINDPHEVARFKEQYEEIRAKRFPDND